MHIIQESQTLPIAQPYFLIYKKDARTYRAIGSIYHPRLSDNVTCKAQEGYTSWLAQNCTIILPILVDKYALSVKRDRDTFADTACSIVANSGGKATNISSS